VGGVTFGGIRVGRVTIDGVDSKAGKAADGQLDRVALSAQARAQDVVLRSASTVGGGAAAAEGDDLNPVASAYVGRCVGLCRPLRRPI